VRLGQVEPDLVALGLEREQLERALEQRTVLEHATAHRRHEAIDVQAILVGFRHAVDPVAIEEQLASFAVVDDVRRLRGRARGAEEREQKDGTHAAKLAARSGASHAACGRRRALRRVQDA